MRIIDSERGIPTADLKRCVKFYTEVLGFTKASESRDRCTVVLGSDEIVFRKGHKDEILSLRDIGFSLSFHITGIREFYDRVRAAGVEVKSELEFMQPGVSQFSLIDCDGYPIVFGSNEVVA